MDPVSPLKVALLSDQELVDLLAARTTTLIESHKSLDPARIRQIRVEVQAIQSEIEGRRNPTSTTPAAE